MSVPLDIPSGDPIPPGTDDRSGTVPGKPGELDPYIRNAYDMLLAVFRGYGLESLAPKILQYLQQGYGNDTIALMLAETPEYKARFKANEARARAGLPVLSPAEYIATESAYRQLMRASGLPEGFYDSNDDFTNWIAGDVSPSELNDRVNIAKEYVFNADPSVKQALSDYYGIDEGHMVASVLDQRKALPLIERQYRAAQVGGAASRAGLGVGEQRATELVQAGVDAGQAAQGYASIAGFLGEGKKLADIYGGTYGQGDAEAEVFSLKDAAGATKKRKKLASQERASFSGGGGPGRSALNVNMD